jgi:hypothetical protein
VLFDFTVDTTLLCQMLCPICQQEDNEQQWSVTQCNHQFHTGCLIHWYCRQVTKRRCPVCRASIETIPFFGATDENVKTFALKLPSSTIRSCFLRLLFSENRGSIDRALSRLEACDWKAAEVKVHVQEMRKLLWFVLVERSAQIWLDEPLCFDES